jgi:magnesium-transporting ATPase (P-type)
MITGDKMETAECISRYCGLQKHNETPYKLQNITDYDSFEEHWINVKKNVDKMLVIDGRTLAYIL